MEATCVVIGLIIFLAAEMMMVVRVMQTGRVNFALTMLIPGYGLMLAVRNGFYKPYFYMLLAGAAFFVLGAVLSTVK